MKTPDKFFIPDNEVKTPVEIDYSRVDEYIRSAEAFSHSTYQGIHPHLQVQTYTFGYGKEFFAAVILHHTNQKDLRR